MINKIKDKIFSIRTVVGIEIRIEADNKFTFSYLIIENSKGIIAIKEQGGPFETVNDLIIKLPKHLPLSLAIIGKGILFKKLTELNTKDPSKIIQIALPSANLNDFYLQQYLAGNYALVKIAKKSLIDPILKLFQKESFSIIDISFGRLALINLINAFHNLSEEQTLILGEYEFEIFEGKTENINLLPSTNTTEVTLGGEKIPTSKLLAYAAAIQIFLPNKLISNIIELPIWRQEFVHKKLYSKLLIGILLTFLIALLINFIAFNHYSDENNQFQSEKNTNQKIIQLATELEKKLEEKEQFLKSSGWLNPSKISFYADRIASTIPLSITIDDMSINPVEKRKLKEQKIIEFSENIITLSGNCRRSVDLNEWIKNMSSLDFINQIDVKNYSHDEYENLGKFEIEILTK